MTLSAKLEGGHSQTHAIPDLRDSRESGSKDKITESTDSEAKVRQEMDSSSEFTI